VPLCVSRRGGGGGRGLTRAVWSNFEVGSLDFWRARAYADFFAALDASGGFYYERWSDAPVHTLALALLLPKDQLHFFAPLGYVCVPPGRCVRC
jgi:alpha 1,2-mannosyltransferase